MSAKLLGQALVKVFVGIVLIGLLLFVPAGSLAYWQGWLLMGILFIPMIIAGFVMMAKCPELLKKRLNAKEEQAEPTMVVAAGLNYRFQWIPLPSVVSFIFAGVFIIGYILYAEVLKENAYLSRTVEVQENQKVIDTGLYGVVRHPMYMSTFILFLSMPLVLGSVISFAIMLVYIPIISKRIRNEEQVLESGLEGYAEYKTRVKNKVIPFIW